MRILRLNLNLVSSKVPRPIRNVCHGRWTGHGPPLGHQCSAPETLCFLEILMLTCWLDKSMNAWTASLMPGLEKGSEVGSGTGCSWSSEASLGGQSKNSSGDWDPSKAWNVDLRACESRKVWTQGRNVRKENPH